MVENKTLDVEDYVPAHLPQAVIKKLESGAFRSLCEHLRERSDEVPNIDLMTVSGFCRNCLSKWLVVEARKLSDDIQKKASNGDSVEDETAIVAALDAMGYDEAARYVYGMMYPEWKKRHAQKASDEKMEKFQQSKPLWAAHDKQILAKRSNEPPPAPKEIQASVAPVCAPKTAAAKSSFLSNVCCEDPETLATSTSATPSQPVQAVIPAATTSFVPPPLPALSFSLGILTVSDRAASGDYPTGDLSGPAVKEVVESILQSYPGTTVDRIETEIVPDEADAIQSLLLRWSGKTPVATDPSSLDLILTTGGTGFSPRDVTPEATTAILERPCEGLLTFCQAAMQGVQPLAALSRGTAGLVGTTLVANLPGNPQAVKELVPVLLPLALQAVADVKGASVS